MRLELPYILLCASLLACSKQPGPRSPVAMIEDRTPAIGQQPLPGLTCASNAFIDTEKSIEGPLAYRLQIIPTDHSTVYPLTLSIEHAHKKSLLSPTAEPSNEAFDDDYLIRADFKPRGRFDGEKIELEEDDLHINLNRVPGITSPFFVGTIRFSSQPHLPMTCWVPDSQRDYSYDGTTGKCVDKNGEEGRNRWTLPYIRDTSDGECADLGHAKLNEENYSYPSFKWNLKGANLSNSDLVFANLIHSQFEGANLSGLTMGYARIEGTKDAFTKLPDIQCVELSETTFSCGQ